DHLDDTAAISDVIAIDALDAQQGTVADAGRRTGPGMARNMDADTRRLTALGLVPFGGGGDQLAVGIPRRDVGQQRRRQLRALGDLLAVLLDGACVGEFAQETLELGAVGIFEAEFARDLLGADLAGIGADEGDDGVPVRKAIVELSLHLATCLSGAFLRLSFRSRRWFRRRCLGGRSDRR